MFLSCRHIVVNTTFSTGLVGVEVSSVPWLGQLTVHISIAALHCNNLSYHGNIGVIPVTKTSVDGSVFIFPLQLAIVII